MTKPHRIIDMYKGRVFTVEDIEQRIRDAVEDIMDDAEDTATLHNQVAQGKIELTDDGEYLCIEGEE